MTDSIAPRSDQMNAEDLLTGPRTFTITGVRVSATADQPVSVYLAEFPADRPFKPSKTVRRLLVVAWGKDADAYTGKRLTLYRDPAVRFGGQDVGGIRVSHMSDIPKTLTVALSVTRGRRAAFVVEPLTGNPTPPDDPARITRMLSGFAALGVTEGDITDRLGRPREAWSADDLDRLADVGRALQAGEMTRDEAFPPPPANTEPVTPEQITGGARPGGPPADDVPPPEEP
jgi:hypothetical protein